MKSWVVIIFSLAVAGCGIPQSQTTGDRSLSCMIFPTSCQAPRGADCQQPAIQVANISNQTSQDLNVEFSYRDLSAGNSRATLDLSIAAGAEAEVQIGHPFSFSKAGHWEDEGNRWVDPKCIPQPVKVPVKLGLTSQSFSAARNCRQVFSYIPRGEGLADVSLYYSKLLPSGDTSVCPGEIQATPE